MSYATIDEFEMYYECHGHAGDALVLLHGFTGDVTDWRHQVEDLAREHRLLAMDHRGHGRSGAPPDRTSYTIERMAEDVLLLADCLGLERFHLVGHSMGGFIAQEIALRMPERLLSLVLEDTGPEFAIAKVEAVRRLVDSQIRTAEAEGMKALAERITLPHPPHQTPERLAEERTRLASMAVDGFAGAWEALCAWPGTTTRAASIRVPTLVVYGELDHMIAEGSKWLGENVPGAVTEVIAEAGHAPQFERPEIFDAALRAHFERAQGER